ncbi:hypothetical protein BOX15_Mlig018287g1 [Macrostomum lignano]|uniref:Uncharacterized protein n=1 Tax=Macrostomum lignano TaxID=282301 RepID=A0A267F7Q3_9PLAT|nr:hypothetical protein BOX15_Mlig018287g1 [Macrostomum lignano]
MQQTATLCMQDCSATSNCTQHSGCLGMNLNEPRLSFEYRVSKKIAELTQVVHMLFKRQHERECELAAVRSAYESELELTRKDAAERLEAQELLARDREETAKRLDDDLAKRRREFDEQRTKLERKLADRDAQLARLRESRDQMKKMLEEAGREIDSMRSSVTLELSEKGERSRLVEEENAGLREKLAKLSYKLAERERVADELSKELDSAKKRAQKWNKECSELQAYAEEQAKAAEALRLKNKQIENELRTMKRDANRRLSEGLVQPLGGRGDRAAQSQTERQLEEECERLQRELTKYKLELANRDLNLNRVFNEQSPMIVDLKAGRIAAAGGQQPTPPTPMSTRDSAGRSFRSAGLGREKTFHYVVSQDYEEPPTQLRRQRTFLEASLRQAGRQQQQQQQQQQLRQLQEATTPSGQVLRKPQPPKRNELVVLDKGHY